MASQLRPKSPNSNIYFKFNISRRDNEGLSDEENQRGTTDAKNKERKDKDVLELLKSLNIEEPYSYKKIHGT